jgi:hypothetical protein
LFNDNKLTFSAQTATDKDSVSITIPEGIVKLLDNYNCPGETIKLDRDIECQDRNEREDCTRYDESPTGPYPPDPIKPDPFIDYSFLDNFVCVKNN